MELRPIDKSFSTTNDLYELSGADRPLLVKVYRGRGARARRDCERAALELWRREGFDAPEVFDPPGLDGGRIDGPYLVMTYLDGPSLRRVLTDPDVGLEERLATLRRVFGVMRRRHDRAIETAQVRLVHPDSSTGNVVLAGEGVFFLDLEAFAKFGGAAKAASVELAKLIRWSVRDLGMQHRRTVLREAMDIYAGRGELLRLIVRRTLSRPFQFVHRRHDRRKKRCRPGEVTKYDIADALEGMLSE